MGVTLTLMANIKITKKNANMSEKTRTSHTVDTSYVSFFIFIFFFFFFFFQLVNQILMVIHAVAMLSTTLAVIIIIGKT